MWKPKRSKLPQTLSALFVFAILISSINTQCLVDECQTCPDNTTIICTECNPGHYKRTFSGGAKTYNACWKTWKLVASILGSILLGLCYCLCCYACYRTGKDPISKFKKQRETVKMKSPPVQPKPIIKNVAPSTVVETRPAEPIRVVRDPVRYVAVPEQKPATRLVPVQQSPRVSYVPTSPRVSYVPTSPPARRVNYNPSSPRVSYVPTTNVQPRVSYVPTTNVQPRVSYVQPSPPRVVSNPSVLPNSFAPL